MPVSHQMRFVHVQVNLSCVAKACFTLERVVKSISGLTRPIPESAWTFVQQVLRTREKFPVETGGVCLLGDQSQHMTVCFDCRGHGCLVLKHRIWFVWSGGVHEHS